MWCLEKMKLNKFRRVEIPKKSVYFARMAGNVPVVPDGMYSGDDVVPPDARTTDALAQANRANLEHIRREAAEARNAAQASTEGAND